MAVPAMSYGWSTARNGRSPRWHCRSSWRWLASRQPPDSAPRPSYLVDSDPSLDVNAADASIAPYRSRADDLSLKVAQDRGGDALDALGVGDRVDLHDLAF